MSLDLNKMTKRELIGYCKELEKIARDNKDIAERATAAIEGYSAIYEKEGLVKSDAPSLTEH